MTKRFGLSATALKFILAGLMLLDHLYYFLPGCPMWFTWAGRIVAPAFCYLMTQSLRHTRDRAAYLRRMTAAGLIMSAGSLSLQVMVGGPAIHNTIFLSLAAAGAIVDQIERMSGEGPSLPRMAIFAFLLVVSTLFLEGSFLVPAIAVIFYFLNGHPVAMCLCYVTVGALIVLLWPGMPLYQHLQAFAVVPIALYNGERGPSNPFSRWFFYLFYPAHIWALYLAAYW